MQHVVPVEKSAQPEEREQYPPAESIGDTTRLSQKMVVILINCYIHLF
jgi:hypothetical protein